MNLLPNWFGGISSSSTQTQLKNIEKEITIIKSDIANKVDKVNGKGLSTNDFTDAYKNKLENIGVNIVNNDVPSTTPTTPVITTDYVTPQMYGAKGNGYTDDTEAVQAALDSGKYVFFPHGDYIVTKPIIITDKKFWAMDARSATISYEGDDFAVKILNACNCCISIGCVYTRTGGGIKFYSDNENSWNQYVTLYFDFIVAKTDCICAETAGEGWCNENQVYGGQFANGENGVRFTRKNGVHGLNGWKFYNCGIEGVKNGFLFDAGDGEICNNVIVNPRYAESFETALITKGTVYDCKWIAPTPMMPSYIKASADTTRFVIDAPIGTYWHMHDTAYIRGAIIDGKLVGERPKYKTIE